MAPRPYNNPQEDGYFARVNLGDTFDLLALLEALRNLERRLDELEHKD